MLVTCVSVQDKGLCQLISCVSRDLQLDIEGTWQNGPVCVPASPIVHATYMQCVMIHTCAQVCVGHGGQEPGVAGQRTGSEYGGVLTGILHGKPCSAEGPVKGGVRGFHNWLGLPLLTVKSQAPFLPPHSLADAWDSWWGGCGPPGQLGLPQTPLLSPPRNTFHPKRCSTPDNDLQTPSWVPKLPPSSSFQATPPGAPTCQWGVRRPPSSKGWSSGRRAWERGCLCRSAVPDCRGGGGGGGVGAEASGLGPGRGRSRGSGRQAGEGLWGSPRPCVSPGSSPLRGAPPRPKDTQLAVAPSPEGLAVPPSGPRRAGQPGPHPGAGQLAGDRPR